MHFTAHAISIVLAVAMFASGTLKIIGNQRIVKLMAAVNVRGRTLVLLGGLQITATIGLLAGLTFPPFGIAAAGGLILYFAGAIGAHRRAHDPEWQGAAAFLLLSSAALVILILNA